MISDFKKEKVPFTQVANEVLNHSELSWKAKGLYAYLFGKPDGWDFSSDRIQRDSTDGRKSVLAGLAELEKYGILSRKKHGDGRMEYVLKHAIQSAKKELRVPDPKSPNGTVPKSHSAQTEPISNIDNINNKDKESKIDSDGAAAPPKVDTADPKKVEEARNIRDVIEAFGELNPACKKMYGRKDMREASRELIGLHTFEKVMHIIKYLLPKSNKTPYFPNIDTPVQLFNKWNALENACVKYKEKMDIKKPKGANFII